MIVQRVVEILKELAPLQVEIGDRVYPVQWPDAPEYPLVIVQKAGGLPEADMNGAVAMEGTRVQVDVYTDLGYANMVMIKAMIRARLHGSRVGPTAHPCAINASFCINDTDQPVPETERAGPRLRRRMLEFRIWTPEA